MGTGNDMLEVRLYGQRAGTLRRARSGAISFAYHRAYVEREDAAPISLSLPLREAPYGAHATEPWFGGLLPEGANLEELALLCKVQDKDPWTLLRAAGAECAGAVQIVEPGHHDTPALEPVDDSVVAELLKEYASKASHDLLRAARLSLLAGAQYKIALHRDDAGRWCVARAGAPTTHILKPQSRRPKIHRLVENEHWCMRLAHYAGIETAHVEIATIGGETTLLVERYDRTIDRQGKLQRLHQEDLAQALGTAEKYHDDGGPDAAMLAEAVGGERATLFERTVFQWIIGNCDAHAKNYSLLEPGTQRARLSPAYDLVSTTSYRGLDRTLAIPFGLTEGIDGVNAQALITLGSQMGLEAEESAARVHKLAKRCRNAVDECADNGVLIGPVEVTRIKRRIRNAINWWNDPGDLGRTQAQAGPGPAVEEGAPKSGPAPKGSWDL